jgi:hypothetical protein
VPGSRRSSPTAQEHALVIDPQSLTDQGPPDDEFGSLDWAFTDRLVVLTSRLLARKTNFRRLWRIELDLLALQQDVQDAITRAKSLRTPLGRKRTGELRITRARARRLGDTMAWLLFGLDPSAIFPLSENSRVPILPKGDTSVAYTALGQELAPKLGFPLLHDITDILRIGDVTFFRPDAKPTTAEIKATVLGKVCNGNVTTISYQAFVVWPPDTGEVPPPVEPTAEPSALSRPASLSAPRTSEQLRRMKTAHALRSVERSGPTVVDGRLSLIMRHMTPVPDANWDELKALVRRAKRTGYASASIGGAAHYVVMYVGRGQKQPANFVDIAAADLVKSDIWYAERDRNIMVSCSVPEQSDAGPWKYLPFYLAPLPRTWIADIVRGQLGIMAFANLERIAAALRDEGFKVRPIDGPTLTLRHEFKTDGVTMHADLSLINEHVTKMLQELLPISYVTSVARTMATDVAEHLPGMVKESLGRTSA